MHLIIILLLLWKKLLELLEQTVLKRESCVYNWTISSILMEVNVQNWRHWWKKVLHHMLFAKLMLFYGGSCYEIIYNMEKY